MTTGGTESIMLAMLAYRNRAYAKGIRDPEILVPVTSHAAFDKVSLKPICLTNILLKNSRSVAC